ncbi:MAG TPA: LacI family DNA-binding transcriptional regulator [Anaerolineaceae bacterium]
MDKKITIHDVAKQSGVSVSTVSLVLNNKPGVSQETRERVFEVAETLDYQAKPASAPGKSSRLTTIGMIVKTDPDLPPQANPFYSKVIVGIENSCRRNGVNLLFATLPVDENNRPVEVPQLMNNDTIDGLLMVGTFVDETIASLSSKRRLPIVLVDGYSDTDSFDTVISDNFRAAYQAVEYLIGRGHRKIGLVGGDVKCYPSLKERRDGYFRALKENGIGETFTANFNINKTDGEEVVSLLRAHPEITALFCLNDNVGSASIKAVQDLGKRVPEDIAVVGYDDTYIATLTHPALTTMHVDTVAMGYGAVDLLSLRLDHPESARMTLTVHACLVERDSVCDAPAPSLSRR